MTNNVVLGNEQGAHSKQTPMQLSQCVQCIGGIQQADTKAAVIVCLVYRWFMASRHRGSCHIVLSVQVAAVIVCLVCRWLTANIHKGSCHSMLSVQVAQSKQTQRQLSQYAQYAGGSQQADTKAAVIVCLVCRWLTANRHQGSCHSMLSVQVAHGKQTPWQLSQCAQCIGGIQQADTKAAVIVCLVYRWLMASRHQGSCHSVLSVQVAAVIVCLVCRQLTANIHQGSCHSMLSVQVAYSKQTPRQLSVCAQFTGGSWQADTKTAVIVCLVYRWQL